MSQILVHIGEMPAFVKNWICRRLAPMSAFAKLPLPPYWAKLVTLQAASNDATKSF